MKVWLLSDWRLALDEVGAAARRAEQIGADCVALADNLHDGMLGALAAIQATRQIRVATLGLVCFARSPMVTAVAAWDLQAASRGRFQLGLSPLVAPILLQKYAVPWVPPAPRMREYIGALRAIFACWQHGAALDFVGKHYRITRQNDYNAPPKIESPDIPIHIGAIGPKLTELAGEVAVGIVTHPTNSAPLFIRERLLPSLRVGLDKSGTSADRFDVVVNPPLALGSTREEIDGRRESWRQLLAILLSTPEYGASLELFGYAGLGAQLKQLIRQGRWQDLAACIDDALLDRLVPSSDFGSLPDLLEEQYRGLATTVCLALPRDSRNDPELTTAVAAIRKI
jgi:probable F420-dependent oxidoreductase